MSEIIDQEEFHTALMVVKKLVAHKKKKTHAKICIACEYLEALANQFKALYLETKLEGMVKKIIVEETEKIRALFNDHLYFLEIKPPSKKKRKSSTT